MDYRTLMTVALHADGNRMHIEAAATLAGQLDAHLDVLCLGVDQIQMGYFFTGADAMLMQTTLEQARDHSEAVRTAVDSQLEGRSLRWSSRSVVSQVGALTEVIAGQARYADLVVLPMPYAPDCATEDEAILEAALFSADAPVLVVPGTGLPDPFPGPTMIGWNGGDEALRAVRAALPFLKQSSGVDIVVVDPPRRPVDQAQPGLTLSQMLDRHGVNATLTELPAESRSVSEVLLDHAEIGRCGMIVAGAYGHSRFREAILGGATRDFLSKATLPILMTH
ncbi:MAG: universal stress protein [Pseudomonadota bacterium]